jgi:hypothetical protein
MSEPEVKKRRGRPKRNLAEQSESSLNNETKESNAKTITDPLIEPYYIAMDQYCYTVFETITPDPKFTENGKNYFKSVGHYSNVGSALESIAKRKANSQSYSSIISFVKEYKKIIDTLNPLRKL